MTCLGYPRERAPRRSKARTGSLPKSCTRTPIRMIRGRRAVSPNSTLPTRSSAMPTSARPSTAVRSMPKASRDSKDLRGSAPAVGPVPADLTRAPSGLAEGQQIRLKGQGFTGPRGRAGDALITVTVAPHPIFQREGADLRVELPITLYEAVLGAKLRVPTLDGAVELTMPAGTNSGRVFRLKGKGFPAKGGTGDLLVSVRIVLPERSDPELEALMRKWRDGKPYDPRKGMA